MFKAGGWYAACAPDADPLRSRAKLFVGEVTRFGAWRLPEVPLVEAGPSTESGRMETRPYQTNRVAMPAPKISTAVRFLNRAPEKKMSGNYAYSLSF